MPQKQGPKERLKIPQKDIVKFVIKEALQKRKALSQKELAEIITKQLRRGESKYIISGKRARLLALDIPVKMIIDTKRGHIPKRCPACGRGLRRTYSKNLYGKRVLTGLRCSKCSYHGTGGKWAPSRYHFSI